MSFVASRGCRLMMDRVEEELICCVCLDLFDSPIILPCCHNLCKNCAQGLINSNGIRRSFDCPKCRYEVRFNRGEGLDSLPENKALRNIVLIIKKERSGSLRDMHVTTDVRLCVRHNIGKRHYCRTCHRTICEKCLTETHSTFGHNVATVDAIVDEEQEKADKAINEIRTLKTMLEEQYQLIVKKKEKLAHYDRSLHKAVDSEFQQLLLNVSMTKMSLASAPPVPITRRHNATAKEERLCQERLNKSEHLLKMYEASQQASDPGRRIEKMESFLMSQASFVAFQFTSDTFDVSLDPIPRVRLQGIDAVLAALVGVKWSVDNEESVIESKKSSKDELTNVKDIVSTEENGINFPAQKRHGSENDQHVAVPPDEPCSSRTKDDNGNAEASHKLARHTDLNCNIGQPVAFKFSWKYSHSTGKTHQKPALENSNSCVRHKEAAAIRRSHPQMAALSNATVTTAVLQGAPSVHSTDSSRHGAAPIGNLFSFCCRSKKPSLPVGVTTSQTVTKADRPLGVTASKKYSMPDNTENGTVHEKIEHLDRMLGYMTVSPPSDTQENVATCSEQPDNYEEAADHDHGVPLTGHIGNQGDSDHHDNDLSANASNNGTIFLDGSQDNIALDGNCGNIASGGHYDNSELLRNSLRPLNHGENSPFRVVEYIKYMSDPGSASSNPASQSEASSADEGTPCQSSHGSNVAYTSGNQPNLQKSLSVEASTLFKPLFTIGTSPPIGKQRKNYHRKTAKKL